MDLDSISEEEARIVFRYLDARNAGEIGFEEFKNIMHEEREDQRRGSPEKLFGMTMSAL